MTVCKLNSWSDVMSFHVVFDIIFIIINDTVVLLLQLLLLFDIIVNFDEIFR